MARKMAGLNGGGSNPDYLRLSWDATPNIGIGPEVIKKKD